MSAHNTQPSDPLIPQHNETATPTPTSSKSSNTNTVKRVLPRNLLGIEYNDRPPIRPTNSWQKQHATMSEQNLDKDQVQEGNPVASTPMVSPSAEELNGNLNRETNDMYEESPFLQGIGTRLMSATKLSPLPIFSGEMSHRELSNTISVLDKLVDEMGIHFGDNPTNLKAANVRFKEISQRLNQVRVIIAGKEFDDLIYKCSELGVKFESYKLKWSIRSNNSSPNTSVFHGFDSLDISKAAANVPTVTNHERKIYDLTTRVKSLEHIATSVNDLKASLPQLKDQVKTIVDSDPLIFKRFKGIEDSIKQMNEAERLSALEDEVYNLTASIKGQSEKCNQSANCQRSFASEYASFQLSVRNDIESLQNSIELLMSNASTHAHDEPSRAKSITGKIVEEGQTSNKEGNPFTQPQQQYLRNWLHANDPTAAASHNTPQERSDNEDDVSSVSSSTTLDIYGKSLKRQMTALGKLLIPEPSESLDKATLNDIYKNRLPIVDAERRDLQRSSREYLKMRDANVNLCEDVESCLEEAENWSTKMRQIYVSNGHHKKSQTHKLYDTLPKFSANSEIDIFEFLRRFENLTVDYEILSEKSELFYSRYLTASIQDEVVKVREDYEKMKSLLMIRYGDLNTITNNILLAVSKEKLPTDSLDLGINLAYYRKLQSAMQKIDKLVNIPDVSTQEVEDFIYGHEFLKRILQLVPVSVIDSIVDAMKALNQGITRIRGRVAFKTIISCIDETYEKYDSMARNTDFFATTIKSKRDKIKISNPKEAHHMKAGHGDTSDDSEADSKRVNFQRKGSSEKSAKPVSKRQFPCIIEDHDHAITECVEFFLLTPKERMEFCKSLKFRYCSYCLQSNKECKFKGCSNIKNIPTVFVCKECKQQAQKYEKRGAYSVFFCFNEKHTKPSNAEIIKGLEEYITGFNGSMLNSPVNLVGHLNILSGIKETSKPKPLSRPVDDNEMAPIYNTSTGTVEDPLSIDLVDESSEDSIGVMQILSIGGKNLLTLFDRGANQHLIDGQIAEDLQIKVHSQDQSAIGVISGSRIWTGYGMYELYLGPTTEGKYYQLKCQGMKSITSPFPKYSLDELNKEALEYADIHPATPLPTHIGGDSIKLLIGLKNSELEPICVFNLPSGIGLYRSPFQDVFGSVYCFGGPHRIFSDVHKKMNGNINHFYSYFTEVVNQFRGSPYCALKSIFDPDLIDTGHGVYHYKDHGITYSYQSTSGETVYPTPLTPGDMKDLDTNTHDDLEPVNSECPHPHCACPPTKLVYKAKIPLSKLKTFIDEEDKDDLINFRCEKCLRCKCASNSTAQMISLTEQIEQEAIEKSVTINLDQQKVFVDLPFTTPPEKFLKDRHGSDNNYYQALKVYKSQCKISDQKKEEICETITDLQKKGFLVKLKDLPEDHQKLVETSPFKHYMPWRTVSKDSTSTKCRIVVDPSMSGLNIILAKGSNQMNKLTDVLIHARTEKFLWSSDISKMYNCLKLKPTSYSYQLFLYHDELDIDKEPEVYVMVVAWYGVTPSSNQAIFALGELSRLLCKDYPLAFKVLHDFIYVDDIMSGCDTEEMRDQEIQEVTTVLASGGFTLKYVVKSGESLDGNDILKVLGYKWNTLGDTFSPGFGEVNFNKKKRGIKPSNPFPVTTIDDVSKLMNGLDITRRIVVSKIAEFWEPVGIWEPIKVQMKLGAQSLNGLNWDSPLKQDLQEYWHERFKDLIEIPKMFVPRFIFPEDTLPGSNIRLLCLSDAAASMGGAAIYAGVKLQDNTYSCQLLTSKSKMMSNSIPRNELEALRIGAKLAYDVKNILGNKVSEIYFFTDSQVALSWCLNTEKKLRLFVVNRVSEIRRIINAIIPKSDQLPIYHIDGKINTADLLTKPNTIKPRDINSESLWMNGYPWMKENLSDMPLMSYTDIQLTAQQNQSVNKECFPDITFPNQTMVTSSNHCNSCVIRPAQQTCYGTSPESPHCFNCSCVHRSSLSLVAGKGSAHLIDIIYNGYEKTIHIMSHVFDYIWSLKHKAHDSLGIEYSGNCPKCNAIKDSGGIALEYKKILKRRANDYFLKQETSRLQSILPKQKITQYNLDDGILYMSGRLPEDSTVTVKDLDFEVFFDNMDIKGTLPVVSAESDYFYALLMYIHHKVRKHSGNTITLREVSKYVYPIHNARRIIQRVRQNCPRCRLILRKTQELAMGNHPEARLMITPAFYHCMMDICYGFPGKPHTKSRTNHKTAIKIYALVIVCLLTSATNILALESLETQQVVLALERHSSRHGIPSAIYVDNGTQLTSLKTMEMNLRDANHHLMESVGLEILPSTAKSHEERGKVERRIRTLREMLLKTANKTDISMTALEWETIFAKMSSEIDDIPIARADGSTDNDWGWNLLTPNRFKLGRSNNRAIEGPILISPQTGPTQLLKRVQEIQTYWYQLLLDRLHHLIPKPSKWTKTDPLHIGDIIIFRLKDNSNSKLEKWVIGKVSDVQKDGRRILCTYPSYNYHNTKVQLSTVTRSPRDVCIISAASDIPLNSREFFEKAKQVS
jgi:hypothetical protein